ncbi:hypothetical protein [Bdellovibrio sp. BCCA]|uniref:hypothetical protein n=1 Tax=Bdellovibrio sp. BCCA TaxID=3136281 RepID=UPI0030F1121D
MNRVISSLALTAILVWLATYNVFPEGSIGSSEKLKQFKQSAYCASIRNSAVLDIRVRLFLNVGVKKGNVVTVVDQNVTVECQNGKIHLLTGLGRLEVPIDTMSDQAALKRLLMDEINNQALRLILNNPEGSMASLDGDNRTVWLRDTIEADLAVTFFGDKETIKVLR